jgi:predicted metal-dependent phosphoesterase TrpH
MRRPPESKGGRRVDLHSHTTFSDGLLSPEALVEHAVERGLAALAVTDHDSLESLPRTRAAAGTRLDIVPGIEISSTRDGADYHILGYFIDPAHPALLERLEGFREERRRRVHQIVERLRDAGVPVDAEVVIALGGHGVVGRPHVAEALLRAGHVGSVDDAFRRFIGPQGVAFVPRPAFRPEAAIELIHAAGGISVLAHPGAHLPDAVIESFVGRGLRGIEVWHPQHGAHAVRRFQALAAKLGLLATGGSDFHGPGRGADLGSMPVPPGVVTALRRAAGVPG